MRRIGVVANHTIKHIKTPIATATKRLCALEHLAMIRAPFSKAISLTKC
ncbi:hypothetical protein [Campylobacter concisus]|nr:hypothetical protein [Campylobacter concisus]